MSWLEALFLSVLAIGGAWLMVVAIAVFGCGYILYKVMEELKKYE